MKLFRRRRNRAKFADASAPAATVPSKEPPSISLNSEQKSLLQKPVDPRVDRILQSMHKIYANKAAAEQALKSRRIIDFPNGNSVEQHVTQDENGFWRIVPGSAA